MTNFVKVMINCNRTSCRVQSVIILVIKQIDFVNHSYDYRPNWTPLSPITITNKTAHFMRTRLVSANHCVRS